jgi:hypothetical protein
MTRDEILAADTPALHVAIRQCALPPDKMPWNIGHADVLDECERRWGICIETQAYLNKTKPPLTRLWAATALDAEDRLAVLADAAMAPTRRLAELRALALALKAKGVL